MESTSHILSPLNYCGFTLKYTNPSNGRYCFGVNRTRIRELFPLFLAVVALNIAGWGTYAYYLRAEPANTAYVGVGLVAYVLGVRHAFDADHIAAIDDSARLMVNQGRRPIGLGFYFAIGHSTVVLLMCVGVSVLAGSFVSSGQIYVQDIGGRIAALVAAIFLLGVGLLNFKVLQRLRNTKRDLNSGVISPAELESRLSGASPLARLLGGKTMNRLQSSWQMFPIGFIVGLGLETASEVTLLSLSAAGAAEGQLPIGAILALPLLFAAGMTLCDSIDSVTMVHAYSSASTTAHDRLFFNILMTAITATIATFVGAIYLSQVLVDEVGIRVLEPIAQINERFEVLGYVIVSVYLVVWVCAFWVWRRSKKRAESGVVGEYRRAISAPYARSRPDE